jgi:hypothetical protein
MFHTVIFRYGQSISFKPGYIILFLNKLSNIPNLPVAIAIDQSKPLHLIIDPLRCEFAKIVDRFEIGCGYSGVGIDVEQIDDGD